MAGKVARCPEGHFYDTLKHTGCPWCGPKVAAEAAGAGPPDPGPQQTRVEPQPQPVTQRYVGDREMPKGFDPVVGWLVCTGGPNRGKDYRIGLGKNFIGRSPSMTISIAGDDAISRDSHAVVTFDPKTLGFWLQPGESSGLVYLNGQLLHAATPLSAEDRIEIGKTTLTLVPFCGEKFHW